MATVTNYQNTHSDELGNAIAGLKIMFQRAKNVVSRFSLGGNPVEQVREHQLARFDASLTSYLHMMR